MTTCVVEAATDSAGDLRRIDMSDFATTAALEPATSELVANDRDTGSVDLNYFGVLRANLANGATMERSSRLSPNIAGSIFGTRSARANR
jgi:hypothetical protein